MRCMASHYIPAEGCFVSPFSSDQLLAKSANDTKRVFSSHDTAAARCYDTERYLPHKMSSSTCIEIHDGRVHF
jgi:hypothetical protein